MASVIEVRDLGLNIKFCRCKRTSQILVSKRVTDEAKGRLFSDSPISQYNCRRFLSSARQAVSAIVVVGRNHTHLGVWQYIVNEFPETIESSGKVNRRFSRGPTRFANLPEAVSRLAFQE
jgi:hypothetical protein